jgi:hypothetical protein
MHVAVVAGEYSEILLAIWAAGKITLDALV